MQTYELSFNYQQQYLLSKLDKFEFFGWKNAIFSAEIIYNIYILLLKHHESGIVLQGIGPSHKISLYLEDSTT